MSESTPAPEALLDVRVRVRRGKRKRQDLVARPLRDRERRLSWRTTRERRVSTGVSSGLVRGRVTALASAIAVFISTPSAPSSMAQAASEAQPTPASTISGTAVIFSRKMRRAVGF